MKTSLFSHRYRIIESLGAGAQGEVMLAIDTVSERRVALKVLHVGQGDQWRKLFKREFEILADLTHPYLAQVYDFGVSTDNNVYFTRDYIPGKQFMEATSNCSVTQFLAVCVQLCRALRPLHRSGLIHGDIKPGNLVLGPLQRANQEGWTCRAHPIDFSFVRPAVGQSPPRGTLQYMAPEILEQQPVDVRADLYALGVSMFQAVTGVCPFEADVNTILQAHRQERMPSFTQVRLDVQNEREKEYLQRIERIVQRLLTTKPESRYPDLDELEAALTGVYPGAVVPDNESAIPSRNVLATRAGFTQSILRNVNDRLCNRTNTTLNVIEGEVGSGRSAVRKVVKWQAQLNGMGVVEIDLAGRVDFYSDAANLLLQFGVFLGDTEAGDECASILKQLQSSSFAGLDISYICQKIAWMAAGCARLKPMLITVDNVDRAGTETLMVLRSILAESNEDAPMAMLATATPDFRWQDALGLGALFTISALNEAEVAELIKRYLEIDGTPLAPRIITHTGGNPLFVTQLLHECIMTSKSPDSLLDHTTVSNLNRYWQLKLTELSSDELTILKACAILNRPSPEKLIGAVAGVNDQLTGHLENLCRKRWLTISQKNVSVRSTSLSAQVLSTISDVERVQFAERAFRHETVITHKIVHGALCKKTDFVHQHALGTLEELERIGALSLAREIATAALKCPLPQETSLELKMVLGRLHMALGELETAREWLMQFTQNGTPSLRQSALRYLGRISVMQSSLDEAADLLHQALAIDETSTTASSILDEISGIEFRRGNYAEAVEIANRGLELAEGDAKTACNLLCSKAKAHAAMGKHDVAIALADDAVNLAIETGEKQLLAFARDVRAWVLSLQGNMRESTDELERCVTLYREVGDVARLARSLQVVGNNYWWLERWDLMLKKHEEAMRVVASLDNPAGRNEQYIAYGFALNCIGRFEKAALVLSRAKTEAIRLGDTFQQAKVAVYEGDMYAWQGKTEEALSCWQQGYDGFERLSNFGLLAELCLEIAGVLLESGEETKIVQAENWIKRAKTYRREDLGRHFEELLMLTEGQYLLAKNEYTQGFAKLIELIEKKTDTPNRQLKWQAHLVVAESQIKKNMNVLARKQLREAERLLLQLSDRFSIADQKSFWQDIRRKRVRELLDRAESEQVYDSEQYDTYPDSSAEAAKLYRVLAFNKRISKETDLHVLPAEILDAAIELTGAERGFFLVKEEDGLVVRAEREMNASKTRHPDVQFSSSIAESVYLDNEAVLTVDAAKDPRFNEFLSIHHLQIKSVACLPVAYRNSVLGVLYLENRLARGKFNHLDMRVLSTFADQMAIALAHAQAVDEINQVRQNLENTALRLRELVEQQSEDLRSKEASLELAKEQLQRMKTRVAGTGSYHGLIGSGEQMQRVFTIVERVKNNDIPIVLIGESGTGKDAVAKVIHEVSKRQQGPFVTLPCGAIPENLVESTLFGHRQGAFSGAQTDAAGLFESAAGGTLYLDDLAEMPKRMQVDLLRVLQEGAFTPLGDHRKIGADFRLLCSSKVPLEELVERGLLRADLFYRLQVITIPLPPLRERSEDIPLLVSAIVKRESSRLEIPEQPFDMKTVREFMTAQWNGNIRELEQAIRRTLVIGPGIGSLESGILNMSEDHSSGGIGHVPRRNSDGEKELILTALQNNQWNKSKAAKAMGIPRRTFYRRLKHFNIL